MKDFLLGIENKQATAPLGDLFNPTFEQEYELMRSVGEKRFGSYCAHEKVKNGTCRNCLRKVITKIGGGK